MSISTIRLKTHISIYWLKLHSSWTFQLVKRFTFVSIILLGTVQAFEHCWRESRSDEDFFLKKFSLWSCDFNTTFKHVPSKSLLFPTYHKCPHSTHRHHRHSSAQAPHTRINLNLMVIDLGLMSIPVHPSLINNQDQKAVIEIERKAPWIVSQKENYLRLWTKQVKEGPKGKKCKQ